MVRRRPSFSTTLPTHRRVHPNPQDPVSPPRFHRRPRRYKPRHNNTLFWELWNDYSPAILKCVGVLTIALLVIGLSHRLFSWYMSSLPWVNAPISTLIRVCPKAFLRHFGHFHCQTQTQNMLDHTHGSTKTQRVATTPPLAQL